MSKDRDRMDASVGGDRSAKALKSIRWELQALGMRPYAAGSCGPSAPAQAPAPMAKLSSVPRTSV